MPDTNEQRERTVRLHATVDHYERTPFKFDVTVEAPPWAQSQVGEYAKAAALIKLAEYFESRVGSRAPWPSKKLIVEFEDDE